MRSGEAVRWRLRSKSKTRFPRLKKLLNPLGYPLGQAISGTFSCMVMILTGIILVLSPA